jgi:hypothetical protein
MDFSQLPPEWVKQHPYLSLAIAGGVFFLWRLPDWLGQVWPLFTRKTVPEWVEERRWPGMSTILYRLFNIVTTVIVVTLLVIIMYQQRGIEEQKGEPASTSSDSSDSRTESMFAGSFGLVPIVALAVYVAYLHFLLRGARQELDLIQKNMELYVLPRKLTAEQQEAIAQYLSAHEPYPVAMKIISRNEEARKYGEDLQQSLEKGGWPVADITYDDRVQEGLHIHTVEPLLDPKPKNPFDRLKPKKKLIDILREAFEQAGVTVNGTQERVGEDIKTTTVTISVGNRRRDGGTKGLPKGPLVVVSPIYPVAGE